MRKPIFLILAALPLFLATNASHARLRVIEQAIETTTSQVSVPNRTPATLFAKSCSTCASRTLQITNATIFQIGDEKVTFQEFSRHVKNPAVLGLGIYFDRKTQQVTRLMATATPLTQRS